MASQIIFDNQDKTALNDFINCVEDQEDLRRQVGSGGMFIVPTHRDDAEFPIKDYKRSYRMAQSCHDLRVYLTYLSQVLVWFRLIHPQT